MGLAAAIVSCGGGSGPPPELPSGFEQSPRTLAGVVYIDTDGDEMPGSGDIALAGASVRSGTGLVRFVTGRGDATTGDAGGFTLELPAATEQDDDLFVEVELSDPNASGGSGSLFYRQRVQAGTVDLNLALRAPVHACPEVLTDSSCGNLLLPDLVHIVTGEPESDDRPLPAESWSIDTTTQPGRRLLRFASTIANRGDGPLHVIAVKRTSGGMETVQRTWTTSNGYRDRRAGTFVFHEGHDHMHLDGFELYRLLDANGRQVAAANKVSFCLTDSWIVESQPLGYGVYTDESCGEAEQAINVGAADYYGADLDGQWIDVTDVDPGTYWVELTVDPDGVIDEVDESNNVARFEVTLTGGE